MSHALDERDLPITGTDFLLAKQHVRQAPTGEIRRALELVNLADDVVRKPIGSLSGGQFQRLLLAFAFLGKPDVLLFDEPTAGIDEPGEERLYDRIDRLKEERPLTLPSSGSHSAFATWASFSWDRSSSFRRPLRSIWRRT